MYNDDSTTSAETHNLRLRASSDGKVSGDGILYFDIIIERSCYDKEVTIDTSVIDSSSYTFEIGRDSIKTFQFITSAIKFDGDADACSPTAYFKVFETSTPSVWYTPTVLQCGSIVSEGDISIFTRWSCMGFQGI